MKCPPVYCVGGQKAYMMMMMMMMINEFVAQVNNVLCFFSKLKSSVLYKLFKSYEWAGMGANCCYTATLTSKIWVSRGGKEKCAASLEIAIQNSRLVSAIETFGICYGRYDSSL